ncbi:MAG: biotin-requiring enzyme [Gammaproteobacteria bacterium]|nr:biotin-requiring enzyme [Gammaproteobacteria bacterium]
MSANVRTSLLILFPVFFWFVTGVFQDEDKSTVTKPKVLSSVIISEAVAEYISPEINLNTFAQTEKRVNVKAKTSGEIVSIGAKQGEFVKKDDVLCSLGIVELNRTEVKAPFNGYIESILKEGNFIQRGQICATIIELNPITFVAEVPEILIKDVFEGLRVNIDLVTGERILTELSFVSKSANPSTRTFRVEAQIDNSSGLVRDGISGTMKILRNPILAHKILPSILMLTDDGLLGVKTVNADNVVEFHKIEIIQDTIDGIWVKGIPQFSNLIVAGQGFVKEGQTVSVTSLASL